MNAQKIAVVTDTGTNVPADFAEAHDIRQIPLQINYTEGRFRSGVDITSEEVIERFSTEIPTTSLPSPASIRETLEEARADGYERAVIVTISSGLSATNQTCHLVANQMEDFPVAVVDTRSIGVAAGMTVMDCALMVEAGVDFDLLEGRLNAEAEQTWVLFSLDELSFLRHGGRISEATYRLGSALNMKPVFECDEEGRYRTVKKCRGRERALKTTVDLIAERARLYKSVVLACASATGDDPMFERYVTLLQEKVGNACGLIRSRLSPDLLVHTGPTLIGMAVQPAMPEMAEWAAARA